MGSLAYLAQQGLIWEHAFEASKLPITETVTDECTPLDFLFASPPLSRDSLSFNAVPLPKPLLLGGYAKLRDKVFYFILKMNTVVGALSGCEC